MARFLSPEWFGELTPGPARAGPPEPGAVTVEIVVTDGPQGEVRYQVVVEGNTVRALWRSGDLGTPDVSFSMGYATISAIAEGRVTPVEALADGRARASGNTAVLACLPRAVDLVPVSLRAVTTF